MKTIATRQVLTLAALLSLQGTLACADSEAPFFIDTQIAADSHDGIGPYGITTVVRDDRAVRSVQLVYRYGLDAAEQRVDLHPAAAEQSWVGELDGPRRAVKLYYYLEAFDAAKNVGRDPALAPDTYSFDIDPDPLWQPDADAGIHDSGQEDAGPEDAALEDAGAEDGATADATQPDAALPDVALADAVNVDDAGEDGGN